MSKIDLIELVIKKIRYVYIIDPLLNMTSTGLFPCFTFSDRPKKMPTWLTLNVNIDVLFYLIEYSHQLKGPCPHGWHWMLTCWFPSLLLFVLLLSVPSAWLTIIVNLRAFICMIEVECQSSLKMLCPWDFSLLQHLIMTHTAIQSSVRNQPVRRE